MQRNNRYGASLVFTSVRCSEQLFTKLFSRFARNVWLHLICLSLQMVGGSHIVEIKYGVVVSEALLEDGNHFDKLTPGHFHSLSN